MALPSSHLDDSLLPPLLSQEVDLTIEQTPLQPAEQELFLSLCHFDSFRTELTTTAAVAAVVVLVQLE